ncbi:MAG: hypothetical protein QOG03_1934, partial [Actinomycetota bacterium]|nr:hypothetical protein [Actinomycetota bacterium]
HGSAIGASIVGLSVGNALSVYGGGEGLYWVLAHHDAPCGTGVAASACPAIKVVNNSWGPAFVAGVANNFDPNSAIVKIQRRLVAGGVTVVWSAGNGDEATGDGGDGSDNRVNQYAQDPTDGVIAVANYDDQATGTRDGSLDSSSSRGKAGLQNSYPDIAAPGHNITAACTLTLPVCTSFGYAGGAMPADPNSYNTISGTSMAAPHISGIVAQLTQANPSLTPAQIENVVKDTAYKFTFGAAYEADSLNAGGTTSFDKGAGLVDVVAAAASILNVPAPPAPLVCGPGSPQVLDPAGDANEVILVGNTPTPSEDSLDVTEGRLSWDASASAITFNIKVTDWTGTEPAGADGVLFDFTFSYGGASYYIDASSTTTGGDSFLLGNYNPTRTTLTPLSGSFNAATDTISVVLPTALFNSKVAGATMGAGSVLNGFEIVSRRDEVFVVPNADTANGVCPFTAA